MESPFNHSSTVRSKNASWRKVALFVVKLSILVGTGACGSPFMQTSTPFPTLFVPTPDCGSPTLLIGSTSFQIETLQPAPDGSLAVPPDAIGTAYWVEGTGPNYVFVVNQAATDQSILPTITVGTAATVTWQNCNSTTYSVSSAPEASSLNVSLSADQSLEGITIFFPTDVSGAGFMVRGELTGAQISAFNTPFSDISEVQVEIGLLDEPPTSDGVTLRIGVSIYNWGQSPITLSARDVSLTEPDATARTLVSSEPPLPKEIAPGSTETIYFTFPRPSSLTAKLNVLGAEYEIGGY